MTNISLGVLSWNSPITLKNSFESYKESGLLELSNDINCLIQPSPLQNEEIKICKEYNVNYILNDVNSGISSGFSKLIEMSKNEYFLFLENDWVCCKTQNSVKKLIDYSINLLENNIFDIVRLRNLKNPGHPIHSIHHYHSTNKLTSELYLSTHYLKHPHKIYPEYISIYNIDPKMYNIKSTYCVYTNNPTLMSKKFYEMHIKQFICINKNLEPEIDPYWKRNNFKIGISNGLFTHVRIDGHNLSGSNYKTKCACCPLNAGGFSDNINCICCIKPYKPCLFDKNLLNDDLSEEIDEEHMINYIFPRLSLEYFSNRTI
jgi:hypothetical protein